jgi:transposase, IS30 family
MQYRYRGATYATRKRMLAARRRHYVRLVMDGMSYTEAARTVGVSKRTGKVWRNGRTRVSGRDEPPCREWLEAQADLAKRTESSRA